MAETLLERWYLIFPLASAMIYAVAAMGYKAARAHGIGAEWLTILANAATGLAFLAFADWRGGPSLPSPLWPCLALGFLFFLGQAFTVMSLSRGDVSVATPVLGSKVVMVAGLLAILSRDAVSWQVGGASVLTVVGIGCLGLRERHAPHHHVLRTVVLSLLAALAFALFDVTTQTWSPRLGFGRLVPPAMLLSAVFSFGMLGFAKSRTLRFARTAWAYLAIGVALMTLQAVLLVRAIGLYGDAAAANIAYGTRAVWSVVVVWAVGHWFGNTEFATSRRIVAFRLAGSILILGGLALAVWPGHG
ncbi:MAG: EamA/RhaT family transporter [Lentisphaeria bacterium]|nr:EamA/RhaT family transporter [Lentisphaeria bacterium]